MTDLLVLAVLECMAILGFGMGFEIVALICASMGDFFFISGEEEGLFSSFLPFKTKGKSRKVFNFFFHHHLKRRLIALGKFQLEAFGFYLFYNGNQHRREVVIHPAENYSCIY